MATASAAPPVVDVAPPPEPAVAWTEATRSPWPAPETNPREARLAQACGGRDGALDGVVRALVEGRARGAGKPDADRVEALLRARGVPHVRPRLLTASGRAPIDDDALSAKLASLRTRASRCGVAIARTEQNKELVVAVAVDALADLEPLPARGRTGQWLTFTATLRASASGAKLVVLGPRGAPRTVPTTIDARSGRVTARFALDRPGAFVVQLVAEVAGGLRPVLEARVFADVVPPADEASAAPAPGEDATGSDGAEALERMTASLRASEAAPPLARDARLDALAREHAEAMRAAATLAHDVGEGDLAARFEAAGLAAAMVGENVARARSVALAHRALHASPSHRMNLLRADYTHVGLAAVQGEGGDVYVCQIFAAGLR